MNRVSKLIIYGLVIVGIAIALAGNQITLQVRFAITLRVAKAIAPK